MILYCHVAYFFNVHLVTVRERCSGINEKKSNTSIPKDRFYNNILQFLVICLNCRETIPSNVSAPFTLTSWYCFMWREYDRNPGEEIKMLRSPMTVDNHAQWKQTVRWSAALFSTSPLQPSNADVVLCSGLWPPERNELPAVLYNADFINKKKERCKSSMWHVLHGGRDAFLCNTTIACRLCLFLFFFRTTIFPIWVCPWRIDEQSNL